jgi:hypothetical protein
MYHVCAYALHACPPNSSCAHIPKFIRSLLIAFNDGVQFLRACVCVCVCVCSHMSMCVCMCLHVCV